MAFKVRLSSRANLEIYEAVSWYESRQLFLGESFLKDLYKNLERISSKPHQFIKRQDFWHALLNRFPFVIVYQVKNETILVLSIFNTHQNPSKKP
ncbi:type II toxin-antitoxin system RelE/ParE family toxin [Mesonia sp.]|uniref:type II toxin-antitoxin system RelE/ParE family toxin n=1 Tax=Mesonia sp. TaxID=1960830 RepID=UPI003F94D2DD